MKTMLNNLEQYILEHRELNEIDLFNQWMKTIPQKMNASEVSYLLTYIHDFKELNEKFPRLFQE